MAVRGAPAIGCVAAYGMALAVQQSGNSSNLTTIGKFLKSARPTAVNLAWAVDRMLAHAKLSDQMALFDSLLQEAVRIEKEDVAANETMGKFGAKLFPKNSIILTHCNTGALATAGLGTALGVIREAYTQGRVKKVFVDETRPYLQGARLTAWELAQEKIPHELITDNMAAHFMKTEKVAGVIVGCDRVAANGDTANKIGTYGLAVLAKYHKVPFYVAMPTSTLDLNIKTGKDIPIEERSSDEVTTIAGKRMAPHETVARHPAFDVTPAPLITAIISEKGVAKAPYIPSLKKLINKK
jgi:methylthioribose-1-phosphate isomerase